MSHIDAVKYVEWVLQDLEGREDKIKIKILAEKLLYWREASQYWRDVCFEAKRESK